MVIAFIGMLMAAVSGPAAAAGYPEPAIAAANISPASFEFFMPVEQSIENPPFHIPIVLNDSVEAYIEHFRTRGKSAFQQGLNNSIPHLYLMKEIFRNHDLPEELVYVVMIETWFTHDAVSRAKAAGPWQIMPGTARQYGLRSDSWVDERRDSMKSTRAAARHIRHLHARLGSWPLVLAAYNAGMTTVKRAMYRTGSNDFWDLKQSAYLAKETKGFVPKIMAAAVIARNPAAYGFRVPDQRPLRFDVAAIDKSIDLRVIANDISSTYATIKSLNPELIGAFTPPGPYLLKIPEGKRNILAKSAAFRKAAVRLVQTGTGFGGDLPNSSAARSILPKKMTLAGSSEGPAGQKNTIPLYIAQTGKQRKIRGGKYSFVSKEEPDRAS